MNLNEFIETKRIGKLKEITGDDIHDNIEVFIYLDGFFIYDKSANFHYSLILENMEYVDNELSILEKQLYEFCITIGAIE